MFLFTKLFCVFHIFHNKKEKTTTCFSNKKGKLTKVVILVLTLFLEAILVNNFQRWVILGVLFYNNIFKIKKYISIQYMFEKKKPKLVLNTVIGNYGFTFKLKSLITNYGFNLKKFKTVVINYGFDEDPLVWALF